MKHHRRKPFSYVFFLVLIIMITVSSCSPSVKDTVDNDSSRQTAKTKTPLNSIDSSTSKEAKVNKGKEILVNPADGAEMILIPAGEFTMGASDSDKKAQEQEKPAHKVYLDAYYIYKYEVTNNQFRKFALETGYKAEGNWEKWVTSGTGDYPAIMVSWNDAAAYCKWAGVKLPTEAQWEKAARGNDDRIYPWGITGILPFVAIKKRLLNLSRVKQDTCLRRREFFRWVFLQVEFLLTELWTCRGMFVNGAPIGLRKITTAILR